MASIWVVLVPVRRRIANRPACRTLYKASYRQDVCTSRMLLVCWSFFGPARPKNDRNLGNVRSCRIGGEPMQKPDLKGQRLAALFLLGCLLFNYPLLSLFNNSGSIWGIPILYAYLFTTWALFISVAIIIIQRPS